MVGSDVQLSMCNIVAAQHNMLGIAQHNMLGMLHKVICLLCHVHVV